MNYEWPKYSRLIEEISSHILLNLDYRDFEKRTFSLKKFLENEHL